MKKMIFILLFLYNFTINADTEHDGEFQIELINHGSSWNVTFTATVLESTWWDDSFNLTTSYSSASVTIPTEEFPAMYIADFDFVTDRIAGANPIMAVGKYRITAYEYGVKTVSFSMDWRTSDYGSSPDVYFKYDVGNDRFRNSADTETITDSTQTVWDLVSAIDHDTTGLQPYAPVNLSSSTYQGHPKISWERQTFGVNGSARTEDYVTGYDIYRSITSHHIGYSKIGSSTTTSYVDEDLVAGSGYTAYYKVKAINGTKPSNYSNYLSVSYQGFQKTSDAALVGADISHKYSLGQNYPNPFNPSTTINYSLLKDDQVSLKIFNMGGEEVMELVNETKSAGNYNIIFNAENLPSGIYIYRLITNNFTDTKKFTLLK